ncbi:hypothetical protein TNCV_2912371 [Trichonephila clavipes]|nr:hypothetical protein TNCV_2912371 [Trichonephila clavipes]
MYLVHVPLNFLSASIEHVKIGMPVSRDATSTIVIFWDKLERRYALPSFSPYDNTSRITVQTESGLITEENLPQSPFVPDRAANWSHCSLYPATNQRAVTKLSAKPKTFPNSPSRRSTEATPPGSHRSSNHRHAT